MYYLKNQYHEKSYPQKIIILMKEFEKIGLHLSLKDRVYESIKTQIIRGTLKPNQHLSEAMLSEAMNISRAPIREAINMLEKEGFVTIIPRKGARVSGITREEVENIWELRSVLEGYAARTAARKCTENELEKMEATLDKLLQEPFKISSYTHSDLKMHELLYKHLDNTMLKEIIARVRQNALRILNFASKKLEFDKKSAIADTHEHKKIVAALKARDPQKAESAVKQHLANSKQRIIFTLEDRG